MSIEDRVKEFITIGEKPGQLRVANFQLEHKFTPESVTKIVGRMHTQLASLVRQCIEDAKAEQAAAPAAATPAAASEEPAPATAAPAAAIAASAAGGEVNVERVRALLVARLGKLFDGMDPKMEIDVAAARAAAVEAVQMLDLSSAVDPATSPAEEAAPQSQAA